MNTYIKKYGIKYMSIITLLLFIITYIQRSLSIELTTGLFVVYAVLIYAYFKKGRMMVIPTVVMYFVFLLTSNIYVYMVNNGLLVEGGEVYTILECFYFVMIIAVIVSSIKMYSKRL